MAVARCRGEKSDWLCRARGVPPHSVHREEQRHVSFCLLRYDEGKKKNGENRGGYDGSQALRGHESNARRGRGRIMGMETRGG